MALPWQVAVSGTTHVWVGGCWECLDTVATWFPLGGGTKAFGKPVPTHQIPTGATVAPPDAIFPMSLHNVVGVAGFGHVGPGRPPVPPRVCYLDAPCWYGCA